MARKLLAIAVVLFMAGVCQAASWLEDAIKRTGENLGNRAVHEAGDTAYDGAKDGAKGTVKGSDKEKMKSSESRPESGGTDADSGVATKR